MCPEKAKINLNKTAVIACAIVILILISGLLIYRFLMLRPIPELKRIADLEVSHFEATFISFDGDKLTSISHHAKTLDVQFSDILKIRRFCNLKGTKVTDWTPDKIKYPVCYLTALFYSKSIGAGRDDVQDYNLGFFGKLPSGQYRIVVFGKQEDMQDYALAEFSV